MIDRNIAINHLRARSARSLRGLASGTRRRPAPGSRPAGGRAIRRLSESSLNRLEELLELHRRADVALDLQLAGHVRGRRVLLAAADLLERLGRRRDRHVGVAAALVDRQLPVADVDEPLALALDVEEVRVVDAGELRLVDP